MRNSSHCSTGLSGRCSTDGKVKAGKPVLNAIILKIIDYLHGLGSSDWRNRSSDHSETCETVQSDGHWGTCFWSGMLFKSSRLSPNLREQL